MKDEILNKLNEHELLNYDSFIDKVWFAKNEIVYSVNRDIILPFITFYYCSASRNGVRLKYKITRKEFNEIYSKTMIQIKSYSDKKESELINLIKQK